MDSNLERSCGAVVYTRRDGQLLYVIVQEQGGAYSYPKGHMEGNETEEETARREVFEEIGLKPVFTPGFRETDEYDLREKPGTRKKVVYFLAEMGNERLVARPGEIRRIQLLPYGQAIECFDHEGAKRVLASANDFLKGGGL